LKGGKHENLIYQSRNRRLQVRRTLLLALLRTEVPTSESHRREVPVGLQDQAGVGKLKRMGLRSTRFWLVALPILLALSIVANWVGYFAVSKMDSTLDSQDRLITMQQNIIDNMQKALTPVGVQPVY
jgi:hypothetical protein